MSILTVDEPGETTPALYVSEHARDRWRQRAPPTTTPVEEAVQKAVSVDHVASAFTDQDGNVPHDVLLYHAVTDTGEEYTMLFIVSNYVVVTTYRYHTHQDDRVSAYLHEMIKHSTVYE